MNLEKQGKYFSSIGLNEKESIFLTQSIITGKAYFGLPKLFVDPLIKKGLIHKDTYKFTGGAIATKKAKELYNTLNT